MYAEYPAAMPMYNQTGSMKALLLFVALFGIAGGQSDRFTYIIIQQALRHDCVPCHRPNQPAPFSMLSYNDVKPWIKEIEKYIREGLMPPFRARTGDHYAIANDRRMSEQHREMILGWLKAGAPRGEGVEDTENPYREGAFVYKVAHEFQLPEVNLNADGEEEQRAFVLDNPFEEDVHVQVVDVLPGNPRVVHHVTVFADPTRRAREWNSKEAFELPGIVSAAYLGMWEAGYGPMALHTGTFFKLPKGWDIVVHVRYLKTGKPEKDRSRIGITLADKSFASPLAHQSVILQDPMLEIPKGAERYEKTMSWISTKDQFIASVSPFMRRHGRKLRITIKPPNNPLRELLIIDDWDKKWQTTYHFSEPAWTEKGAIVTVQIEYDASTKNPRWPAGATANIKAGMNAEDELAVVYLHTVDGPSFRRLLESHP